MNLPELFRLAQLAQHRGDLAQARRHYSDVLARDPKNFAALNLLAAIEMDERQYNKAVKLIQRSLKVNPTSPQALNNLGNALRELGRFDDALTTLDQALALMPDDFIALYNRALVLQNLGRFHEALAGYDRAISLSPNFVEALNNRGAVLQKLAKYQLALKDYDSAIAARPQFADAYRNRAVALTKLGRPADALASLDTAIALAPDNPASLYNKGIVLEALNRNDEALQCYDRTLEVTTDHIDALNSRGLLLQKAGRFTEALADYDRALSRHGSFPEVRNNRANLLVELNRFDEALVDYDRAIALRPDFVFVDALINRAHALRKTGRWLEALNGYDDALKADPARADARVNAGFLRLLLGEFAKGWDQYESRWEVASFGLARRNFPQPQWRGDEDLEGKTILIHAEQGQGDTIQMVRYVRLLALRGARAILEVPKSLRRLLNGVTGAVAVIEQGEMLPPFDLHCPIMSLPLAFKTELPTIPSLRQYVTVDPARGAHLIRPLDRTTPRVGLAWSGNPRHADDRNRSIMLETLSPLLTLPLQFVSLQKDTRTTDTALIDAHERILHMPDQLTTFADTASLIDNLDLVISVDTSVAHLAGALGKPVWILLPFAPDWRWLLARDDSPWYPTATLFRQPQPGDWASVIKKVLTALSESLKLNGIDTERRGIFTSLVHRDGMITAAFE